MEYLLNQEIKWFSAGKARQAYTQIERSLKTVDVGHGYKVEWGIVRDLSIPPPPTPDLPTNLGPKRESITPVLMEKAQKAHAKSDVQENSLDGVICKRIPSPSTRSSKKILFYPDDECIDCLGCGLQDSWSQ